MSEEESYQDVLESLVVTEARNYDNTARMERYHEALYAPEGAKALEYLHKERGLVDSTIKHFKLGYVDKPYPIDRMSQRAISIPYMNPAGVFDIRFRRGPEQSESAPKYSQAAGSKTTIYNVNEIDDKSDFLIIGEGEFTAIMMWQIGLPAIAFPGVNSFKSYHRHLFEGFRRVYLCGDGDEAGARFNEELAMRLRNGIGIALPEGEDLDSYCRKFGAEKTRQLIIGDK